MILVFAGAGASAAVNKEMYPATQGFFDRLPDNIKGEPWFGKASQFLTHRKNLETIDIEHLLGLFREMQEYLDVSCNTDSFPGWMLEPSAGRLRDIDRENRRQLESSYFVPLIQAYSIDRSTLRSLRNRIHALVYDVYAEFPNDDDLAAWLMLLKKLVDSSHVIEVFTTNYDRVLEKVIDLGNLNDRISTGKIGNWTGTTLDLNSWTSPIVPKGQDNRLGMLTKLHGSVEWQREGDGRIVVGASQLSGSDENRVLLYPGHKEDPDEEPFIAFHSHLRSVVQEADAAIFIGYAFRDDYIDQILTNLPPDIPKVVIDIKALPPDKDFLHGAAYSGGGFTDDSVTACLEFIKQGGVAMG